MKNIAIMLLICLLLFVGVFAVAAVLAERGKFNREVLHKK